MTMIDTVEPGKKSRARPSFYFRYMVEPYLYLTPAIVLIALVLSLIHI